MSANAPAGACGPASPADGEDEGNAVGPPTGAATAAGLTVKGLAARVAAAALIEAPGVGDVASFTRKLTLLTMTCAGSLGTLTELSAGGSSKEPAGLPPVGVRGVLVSTLI